jgi:hypothetical protein
MCRLPAWRSLDCAIWMASATSRTWPFFRRSEGSRVHGQGFQPQTAFSRPPLEPVCGQESEGQRRGEPAGEIRSAAKEFGSEEILVPSKGLEPPHPCGYMDLNHARLPIPPRWPGHYSGSLPLRQKWDGCGHHKAAPGKNCSSILQTHRPLSNALRLAVSATSFATPRAGCSVKPKA